MGGEAACILTPSKRAISTLIPHPAVSLKNIPSKIRPGTLGSKAAAELGHTACFCAAQELLPQRAFIHAILRIRDLVKVLAAADAWTNAQVSFHLPACPA